MSDFKVIQRLAHRNVEFELLRFIFPTTLIKLYLEPYAYVSRLSFSHFVNNANNAYMFTMKLEKFLVNDKITVSRQKNISPKHYIKYFKQQK